MRSNYGQGEVLLGWEVRAGLAGGGLGRLAFLPPPGGHGEPEGGDHHQDGERNPAEAVGVGGQVDDPQD